MRRDNPSIPVVYVSPVRRRVPLLQTADSDIFVVVVVVAAIIGVVIIAVRGRHSMLLRRVEG